MERAVVKDRYNKTLSAIQKIEESSEEFLYSTAQKHLPKVGFISDIETVEGVVRAHARIKKQLSTDLDQSSIELLGVKSEELPEGSNLYLGVKLTTWEKDLKTRIAEIRQETRLSNLKNDLVVLKRNLSDDDLFDLEMEGLSNEEV